VRLFLQRRIFVQKRSKEDAEDLGKGAIFYDLVGFPFNYFSKCRLREKSTFLSDF